MALLTKARRYGKRGSRLTRGSLVLGGRYADWARSVDRCSVPFVEGLIGLCSPGEPRPTIEELKRVFDVDGGAAIPEVLRIQEAAGMILHRLDGQYQQYSLGAALHIASQRVLAQAAEAFELTTAGRSGLAKPSDATGPVLTIVRRALQMRT
jgi:hypothetical protein